MPVHSKTSYLRWSEEYSHSSSLSSTGTCRSSSRLWICYNSSIWYLPPSSKKRFLDNTVSGVLGSFSKRKTLQHSYQVPLKLRFYFSLPHTLSAKDPELPDTWWSFCEFTLPTAHLQHPSSINCSDGIAAWTSNMSKGIIHASYHSSKDLYSLS